MTFIKNQDIREQISSDGIPNPNYVLESLLINLINHSLATIQLVENGLDSSAQILLRIVLELEWLTLVLAADKEKMISYAQDLDDRGELEVYNKHFKARKLINRLTEIEKKLDLPEEVAEELKKARSSLYSFYSKRVHNSYAAMMIGIFGTSFKDDELKYGLFGVSSSTSG